MLRKTYKMTSVLLVCILTVLSIYIPTFAAQENKISSQNCYMASSVCPEEYKNFAEENVAGFVLSIDDNLQYNTVAIGTPFSFATLDADVYYFPIICDGVISYLFRVYPYNDGFCGAITDFLAEDIENLSSFTTPENPLYLRLVGSKIVAFIGENEYLLFEYPENMCQLENESVAYSDTFEAFTIVNAKYSTEISLDLHTPMMTSNSQRASITWLDKSEQQGNNSWCAAYCLASIIRTRTTYKNVYAVNCMRDALGTTPTANDSFPREKMVSVASKYGLHPTVTESLVADYILYDQIEAGRPIIQSMLSFGGRNSHAVVLMGYNLINSTWGIWNPWFKSFEWYSMSGTYIPTGYPGTNDNTYLQYRFVYNF